MHVNLGMSKKENNEQIAKSAQVGTDVAFQESKKKKKKAFEIFGEQVRI